MLALAVVFCLSAQAQTSKASSQKVDGPLDTLHIGEREPTFYYWDTNWWDYYYLNFKPSNPQYNPLENLDYGVAHSGPHGVCKIEIARWCYTDKPLKIIGVAAPVDIVRSSTYTYDTTMEGRLPEYFRLYDSSMVMKAEARWDTVTPRYAMALNRTAKLEYDYTTHTSVYKWWTKYAPVYEAYFDSAITVNQVFYVSGTRDNNYSIGEEFFTSAHLETRYFVTLSPLHDDSPRWRPSHEEYRCHSHLCDSANQMYSDTLHWFDFLDGSGGNWLNFFAIIDTSHTSVVVTDTCTAPTNFRLINGDNGIVTFGWNPSGANRWEMSIVDLSADPSETTLTTHTVTFVTFDNFQRNHTYEARVRSVCSLIDSNIYYSDWSDSIKFHLNTSGEVILGEDSTGTIRIETTADRYTYVMPNPASGNVTVASSFRIGDVELLDLNGKSHLRSTVDGLSATLDISSLPAGTYIVRVTTSAGTAYKKLIVK